MVHAHRLIFEHGFNRCPHEHILFIKSDSQGDIVIMCLYVDDLIYIGNSLKLMIEFMEAMIAQFEI